MSDFLRHLVQRAHGQAPVLQRRRPSLFESPVPLTAPAHELTRELASPRESVADVPLPPAVAAVSTIPVPVPVAPAPKQRIGAVPPAAPVRAPAPGMSTRRVAATRAPRDDTAVTTGATQSVQRRKDTEAPSQWVIGNVLPVLPLLYQTLQVPRHVSDSPAAPVTHPLVRSALTTTGAKSESSRTPEEHLHRAVITIPATPVPTPLPQPPRAAARQGTGAAVAPLARRDSQATITGHLAAVAPAPVHVTIGRVEIRASSPSIGQARTAKPSGAPALGLDEYLRQRHGERQ